MATESASVTCTSSFELALAPDRALRLFTPEGERAWVDGWDPVYPGGEPDLAPGAVFLTHGHGGATVWIVAGIDHSAARYARVAYDCVAAWIEVECRPAEAGTEVQITYRLTATDRAAVGSVSEFAAGYDAFIDGWRAAIEAALDAGRIAVGDA